MVGLHKREKSNIVKKNTNMKLAVTVFTLLVAVSQLVSGSSTSTLKPEMFLINLNLPFAS
ncbi:hypothetical protein H8E88_01615 [candidate division KSB1 bacterium]|nr:hypothetical protein [candidate division KSB1 bacterium]